jgi:hypothetical protein
MLRGNWDEAFDLRQVFKRLEQKPFAVMPPGAALINVLTPFSLSESDIGTETDSDVGKEIKKDEL